MPLVASKETNSTGVKSRILSNIQMKLIKLYSTNLEYDDLMELKNFWLIISLKKRLMKLITSGIKRVSTYYARLAA